MSRPSCAGARTTRSQGTLPPGHLNFDHSLYRALDDGEVKAGRNAKQAARRAGGHEPLSPTAGPSGLLGGSGLEDQDLMKKAAALEFAAASSPILSATGFDDDDAVEDDAIEEDASFGVDDDGDDNSHRQRTLKPEDCDWSRDLQDDISHFRTYPASSTPYEQADTSSPSGPLLLPAAEIVSSGGRLGGRGGQTSSFVSGLHSAAAIGGRGTLVESADTVKGTLAVTSHRGARAKGGPVTTTVVAPSKAAPPEHAHATIREKVSIAEPSVPKSRRVTVQDASDDESDAYVPTARAAAAAKSMADKGKAKAVDAPPKVAPRPASRAAPKPAVAAVQERQVEPVAPSRATAKSAKSAAPPVKAAPRATRAPTAKPTGPLPGDDVVMTRAEVEHLVNQAREAGLREAEEARIAVPVVPPAAPAPVPAAKGRAASREEIAQRAEQARKDRALRDADAEVKRLAQEKALLAKAAKDKALAVQAKALADAAAAEKLAKEKVARAKARQKEMEKTSLTAAPRPQQSMSEEAVRKLMEEFMASAAPVDDDEDVEAPVEEETQGEQLETLARENNFTSAKELVNLYRDVAKVLKSPMQPLTPVALKRRTSPKSREEAKRLRHLSPERGGVKRKVSPGEPTSPRKKKGPSREDAMGVDDVAESDTIAIPVKCVEILRDGWVKTLRLSMFTPDACRKDQSKVLGNDANHLEIGPGGTIGLKNVEKHQADNTLREDEWRPAFVNFIRAIEEHYQPRVPDVDEEQVYLIPTRQELASDFQKMFNQLTRRKDYDTQFRVVKLYTERAFTAIQEKRMKISVGRWGENVWIRCLNELAAERGQMLEKMASQLAAMQQQQGTGQKQRSTGGSSYGSNYGGGQQQPGSRSSGTGGGGGNSSQGGSNQKICCIWCGSRAHRYSVCPGGDNIVCRKEGSAWVNKTTKEGYCYPFNIRNDSTCPRTDCGGKFLHACSICGQKGHGAQNHGARNRASG